MADARALLRAHRTENRIQHPHAAYSDAGKLLCKLCHEPIKTESLWDGHTRSPSHRQRLQALQSSASAKSVDDAATNKRKHDDDSMSDADEEADHSRAKRNRTDSASAVLPGNADKHSPPLLNRRASNTPIHGVEIAIPSRPATPLAGSNSSTSTPRNLSAGRSPLIGPDGTPIFTAGTASQPISTESVSSSGPTSAVATASSVAKQTPQNPGTMGAANNGNVDESEWAAFEAELAQDDKAVAASSAPAYDGATISAPALTSAEVAAKSEEEEHELRKHQLEAQMADEREEATRALEDEFDEMEELESRVRKLKERREELRKGSVANLRSAAGVGANGAKKSPAAEGKENSVEVEDDEDDDEEEEDDWDGFRFR